MSFRERGRRQSPPPITGMTSLKVDNLSYRTTVEDLKRAFSKYGELGDVYIPRDPRNFESRGFAFVRFYDKRDAEDAIDRMDGANLDGRPLRVQRAKYSRPRSPQRKYLKNSRSRSRSRSRGSRRSRSRSHSRGRGRKASQSRSRSDSRSPASASPPARKSRSRNRSRSRS